MRLRPTALGWKGLLLLAAMQVAFLASNYNNLFFLLIAFSSVLGGLGALWSLINVHRAHVTRLLLPAAAADQPRTIELEVRTRRRPGVGLQFALVIEGDAGGGRETIVAGELAFVADVALVTAILPPRARGVVSVVAIRLTSCSPFGLFRARRDQPLATEMVTHPEPAARSSGRGAGRRPGDLPAVSGGGGAAVAGLRPFRSGDSAGNVHWKASARRGMPIVREPEPEGDRAFEVVLDRRAGALSFELMLQQVTGWVFAVRELATTMTLHSQATRLVIRSDRASVATALRWLAAAAPLPADAPPPPRVPNAVQLTASGSARGGRG